jgi:hypothetical protein
MNRGATSVADYLAKLPADRRAVIEAVRQVILANLGAGYEEGLQYGMLGYYVPHSVYPAGYHCNPREPLPFAALAAQKNHNALYLMCSYGDAAQNAWLRAAWAKTGKKLDMGKACIRFKKLEDVPLEVIGEAIARVPVQKYIAAVEAVVQSRTKPAAVKKSAGKTATRGEKTSVRAPKTPVRTTKTPVRAAKTSARGAKMPARAAKTPARAVKTTARGRQTSKS